MKQFAGLFAASSLLMTASAAQAQEEAGIPYEQIEFCFKGIKSGTDTVMSKTPERHIAKAENQMGNVRCGVEMDATRQNENDNKMSLLISGFVTATKSDASQASYQFNGNINDYQYGMKISDAGMVATIDKPTDKAVKESRIELVTAENFYHADDIEWLKEEESKGNLTTSVKDGNLTVVVAEGKPGLWLPEEFSATAEDLISGALDTMEKIADSSIPLVAAVAPKARPFTP